MTWYRRLLGIPEKRTLTVPWNIDGPLNMTPSATQDTALRMSALLAAVRCLTLTTSTLPLKAYRGEEESTPIPLPVLFRTLKANGQLIPWLQQLVFSLVVHGNAYGYVTDWDGFGFPIEITWLPPQKVARRDHVWYVDGKPVDDSRIKHVVWMLPPGCEIGISPLEYEASVVGAGLAAQEYGNDGGMPPVVFTNSNKTVTPEEAAGVRQRLSASMRARQPLVVGNDWKFDPVTIPPNQLQFIEQQKLSATQIANVYGLPPSKVGGDAGGSLTYSTVEQESLDFVAAIRPYAEILEHAFASWMPSAQYVRFSLDALVRSDLAARMSAYQIQRAIGLRSLNEIRALEDLPPVEGGDTYLPPVQAPTTTAVPPSRHLSLIEEQT